MQKKIIALAVAGILAAPMAAQAATAEVYGKVRVSVGVVGNDDATAGNEDSKLSVTSHDSRFGIKGSEDLDNGMKAIYQLETEVDFDDNNNGIFDSHRNTFVGLTGDFGKVIVGRHDTPYKISRGKTDVFGDTHGDYNAIFDAHDARADNVLAYISPDMSGVTVAVAHVTDLMDDDLVDTNASQENAGLSLAAMYGDGPLYAALAYQSLGEAGTGGEDHEGTKLTLGYKVGTTNVMFAYENDDMGGSDNAQDRTYISVDHGLGDGVNLKAAIGVAGERGSVADTGATHFTIGASKKMGKTTEFYALYTQLDNDAAATFDLAEIGSAGTTEPSASAIAVGVNMKFSSL